MLPDYDLYDMPDHEEIAQELRAELFKRNNRLEAAEKLLLKIRAELDCDPFSGSLEAEIIDKIDTLLGE